MTRYELLDRIGVGGMAEIFRGKAVAAGGFEKPVAIKRILPHLSQDKRFVELLIAEAKVLSLLKHRNIVQIFDVGLGDDGQYFLVMEHVDGKDLGAVQRGLEARRARMPFDLALHIGAEICEALEHAHNARAPDGKPMSLVHRDVSPSNVMMSRAGEIKLTDFGIAKRAEQEVTGHGAVRGKFAYISPEQARNEHIDPRSDVFSVAIVLWELIANRRLFSGLGDLEALRAVREAQVPRLLEADPRLPPAVDQLLMSALDRDLKMRPTAEQLGARLRTIRYSLEVTVGDPATELAKIIDTADEVPRESQRIVAQQAPAPPRMPNLGTPPRAPQSGGFDGTEPTEATVIRIRTAAEFQARDVDGGIGRARAVIDRFDDEETRQAQLSGDQLRLLRADGENSDLISPPALPGVAPGPRARRPTDEPTAAREPITTGEVPTASIDERGLPANQRFDDESTWLLDRRAPGPPVMLTPTPPMPPVMLTPTPPPPIAPAPGTVHQRNSQRPAPPRPFQEPHSVSARSGQLPLEAPSETPAPPTPVSLPSRAVHANPHASPQSVYVNPSMQQPMHPSQMQQPPQMQSAPIVQAPPVMPGNFPGWGGTQPPMYSQHQPSMPPERASHAVMPGRYDDRRRRPALKPWMLVVGALVMAALAFAVTRWFLS